MLDRLFSPRLAPRRLTGVRCVRWIGSALLLGGAFILGWDIFAGFTRGTRWHLALTCLADVLPSLSRLSVAPPWSQLIEGGLEFAALTPLALVLCGLGWCARILSPGEPGPDPEAGRWGPVRALIRRRFNRGTNSASTRLGQDSR